MAQLVDSTPETPRLSDAMASPDTLTRENLRQVLRSSRDPILLFRVFQDHLQKSRPDLRDDIDQHLKDLAQDLETCPGILGALATSFLARQTKREQKALVIESWQSFQQDGKSGAESSNIDPNLTGLELRNESADRFAVFGPEPGDPETFRFTRFDHDGFIGHATGKTYLELLDQAFDEGYRHMDAGALDRLFANQSDTPAQEPSEGKPPIDRPRQP